MFAAKSPTQINATKVVFAPLALRTHIVNFPLVCQLWQDVVLDSGDFGRNMLQFYKVPCTNVTAPASSNRSWCRNIHSSDNSVEYLKYYTVTGVFSPIDQYNIYWTKHGRLSKYLFLSSSYPKTQLLVPEQRELPIVTYTTTRLLYKSESSFLVE